MCAQPPDAHRSLMFKHENGTHPALRADVLHLTLGALADALAAPQLDAHARVRDGHHHDRHHVRHHHEEHVVPETVTIILKNDNPLAFAEFEKGGSIF
jgi:hypothetical protein